MSSPTLYQKMMNLAQEMVKWIPAGAPFVTKEEQEQRLAICAQCDHLVEMECSLCGCQMTWKTWMATAECPDIPPRWPASVRPKSVEDMMSSVHRPKPDPFTPPKAKPTFPQRMSKRYRS